MTTTHEIQEVEPPSWMLDGDRIAQFLPQLPTDNGQVHILTCPGIGDASWLWAKMQCLEERIGREVTFWFPDDPTKRVAQYANLVGMRHGFLPLDIREILRYPGEFSEEEYRKGGLFYVHANRHLENGKPLEHWHPWLALRNPITPVLGTWRVCDRRDYVTVHMCMASYVEGNWLPRAWARMLEEIETKFMPVKVVGALWDTAFAERVFSFYRPQEEPCLDRPLDDSLKTIAHGRAHIGLDSGLTILAKYMGVPALQAFPRWLCSPEPTEAHPNGTHMPGTYDFDFHPQSDWCYVDELRDEVMPWLKGVLG